MLGSMVAVVVAAGALVTTTSTSPVAAATVSIHVTCSGFETIDVSVVRGDTMEVTFSDNCLNAGTGEANAWTPMASRSYFSALGDGFYESGETITWVVATDAPLGLVTLGASALPYVCNNCGDGRWLRLDVAEAPTTTTTAPPDDTTTTSTTTVPNDQPTTTTTALSTGPGAATGTRSAEPAVAVALVVAPRFTG